MNKGVKRKLRNNKVERNLHKILSKEMIEGNGIKRSHLLTGANACGMLSKKQIENWPQHFPV